MSMRTIAKKKSDGLTYVVVATKPTTTEKLQSFATRLGDAIDRVIFKTDISHLPVPPKNGGH